jgi:hypothetical protein
MGKYVQVAITEKGRLWGTKLAFFRRKEIRVITLTEIYATGVPLYQINIFYKETQHRRGIHSFPSFIP